MTETDFFQNILKKEFKSRGILAHRFEYPRIPDVYLTKNSNSLWAELKCVNSRSSIVEPDWRTGQLAWVARNKMYNSFNICLILWYVGEVFYLHPQKTYMKEELICQKKHYLNLLSR